MVLDCRCCQEPSGGASLAQLGLIRTHIVVDTPRARKAPYAGVHRWVVGSPTVQQTKVSFSPIDGREEGVQTYDRTYKHEVDLLSYRSHINPLLLFGDSDQLDEQMCNTNMK